MRIKLKATKDQQDVVTSTARMIGLFAGRRWGKTFCIMNRIIYRCLSKPGIKYWYIAPSYAQAVEVFDAISNNRELQTFFGRPPKLQPYPRIWWINGSSVGFRSFDRPKNLRGSGLDEAAVDEIQDVQEDYFWPVIRPLLSDRRGTLVVAGQFRGHNWYCRTFYEVGQDKSQSLVRSYRFPSSTGLVFQGEEGRKELELAKSQVPKAIWDQEYECIPTANMYAAIQYDNIKSIIGGWPASPESGCAYVMGLDLGRHTDYTALVVLDCVSGRVVHAQRFPLKSPHSGLAIQAANIAKRYNATVICDTTGGATGGHAKPDEYIKLYRQQMPDMRAFYWSAANKEQIVANLILSIEQRKISVPPEYTDLLDELSAYECKYQNGHYRYAAPNGKHDDYVAALAQAEWGRRCGWAGSTKGGDINRAFY